jgi:hypothetical protein
VKVENGITVCCVPANNNNTVARQQQLFLFLGFLATYEHFSCSNFINNNWQHTHTTRERERERKKERKLFTGVQQTQAHAHAIWKHALAQYTSKGNHNWRESHSSLSNREYEVELPVFSFLIYKFVFIFLSRAPILFVFFGLLGPYGHEIFQFFPDEWKCSPLEYFTRFKRRIESPME